VDVNSFTGNREFSTLKIEQKISECNNANEEEHKRIMNACSNQNDKQMLRNLTKIN